MNILLVHLRDKDEYSGMMAGDSKYGSFLKKRETICNIFLERNT